MTRAGIEPRSPGPLANTQLIKPGPVQGNVKIENLTKIKNAVIV